MIRVLRASSENGEHEEVIFTEDFDTPAEDFFYMDSLNGLTIVTDDSIDSLPSRFPLDYVLVRQ